MRRLVIPFLLAGCATGAGAQLGGGALGGATTGSSIDATMRGGSSAIEDQARAAPDMAEVNVHAGVATRVGRGTRCYDGTVYWKPDARDGGYWCEAGGGASQPRRK